MDEGGNGGKGGKPRRQNHACGCVDSHASLPPPSNAPFEAWFRIQREVSRAAGHHVQMIVENVRGAERWVGRAAWHFGSHYLWGDVPALTPFTSAVEMSGSGAAWFDAGFTRFPSSSPRRRAASAQIAKIPLVLAQHIATVYKPDPRQTFIAAD